MLKFKTPERTQQTNAKKCNDHFCFKGSMDTTLFLLHELIFTRTQSRGTLLIIKCKTILVSIIKSISLTFCNPHHPDNLPTPACSWDEGGGDLLLLEAPQHRQVCDVFTLAKRMEFSLQLYLISAKFGSLGTHRPEFAKWIREGSREINQKNQVWYFIP